MLSIIDRLNKTYCLTLYYAKWLKACRFDSFVRHVLILFARFYIWLCWKNSNKCITNKQDAPIISLTSFPARINNVWMVVESLLHQEKRAKRIMLWLSKEQFHNIEDLPKQLLAQREKGLEIHLVDGDLRSHKKYFYVFQEFPQDRIILVDDDIIYPSTFIKDLEQNFSPERVHCSYGNIIGRDEQGKLLPYGKWKPIFEKYDGADIFFGSGGGTMLVPAKLGSDTLNSNLFLQLCPTEDDVWLNAQCYLAGLRIVKVRSGLIFPTSNHNAEALSKENLGKKLRDKQIHATLNHYPSLFSKQK